MGRVRLRKRPVRRWRKLSRETLTAEPPLLELDLWCGAAVAVTQDLSCVESHLPTLLLKASTQCLYCSLPLHGAHRLNLLLLFQHGGPLWNAGITGKCCVHQVVNYFGCSYVMYSIYSTYVGFHTVYRCSLSCRPCVEVCVLLEAEAAMPLWSIWSLSEALPGLSPISARLFPSLALTARGGEERRKEKGGERYLFVCLPAFVLFSVFLLITVATGPEMWLCCAGQTGLLIQRWKLQIFCERDKWGTQGLWWNEMLNAVPL